MPVGVAQGRRSEYDALLATRSYALNLKTPSRSLLAQPAAADDRGERAEARVATEANGSVYPHRLVSKAASRSCTSTGKATAPA